jgi:hypothetical protein
VIPDLAISPAGWAYLEAASGDEVETLPAAAAARITQAFGQGGAQGLLQLGAVELGLTLPPSLAFVVERDPDAPPAPVLREPGRLRASQEGSQWPRIVVPLTNNRLLDRTLVYTAVTRAQRQVILVGDESAARAAVEGLPRAQTRQVALDLILARMLS